MSAEAIAAVDALSSLQDLAQASMTSERIQIPQLNIVEPGVSAQAGGGFGSLFVNGLEKVNQGLLANQTELQALAVGDRVGLHQVMIRMEESRLNFQLMMQVRGRLLDAYQDVMKMQV